MCVICLERPSDKSVTILEESPNAVCLGCFFPGIQRQLSKFLLPLSVTPLLLPKLTFWGEEEYLRPFPKNQAY